MKKILIPALAAILALGAMTPAVSTEKESKSTTPVVAAVSADYYRQMEAEKVSRETHRAAVQKNLAAKAKAAKIAKAKKLAAKRLAEKKAQVLAKKREEARVAHIAWHKAQEKKAKARKKVQQAQTPKTNSSFSGGSPKAYARSLVGDGQFGCLEALWQKESGWNPHADNPSSDAYGIPQALPGSKMASAGADWATNPMTQIRWGVGYIEDRYGSPCAAWAHSQSVGWY